MGLRRPGNRVSRRETEAGNFMAAEYDCGAYPGSSPLPVLSWEALSAQVQTYAILRRRQVERR